MKKIILIVFIITMAFQTINAQAKQPKIMVIPADIYCIKNNYTTQYDNDGIKETVSDYQKLLQNDENMRQVISKINEIILNRGYKKLGMLEAELNKLKKKQARRSMKRSKSTGAKVKESPLDMLKRSVKPDIIIDVDFRIKSNGKGKYIHFNMQAYDAFNSQAVGNASGDGIPAFSLTTGKLIESAVLQHIDNFLAQLQTHFDDLFEKGRECVFNVEVWEDSEFDLESEFETNWGKKELLEIIDDWFAANSMKGRFTIDNSSENMMEITARIPLYNSDKRALDANRFLNKLRKYLMKPPINAGQIKLMRVGLGEATIVLGGK